MENKTLRFFAIGMLAAFFTLTARAQSWNVLGNTGTNPAADFVGTTDNSALVFRTLNAERMRIQPNGRIGIGTNNPLARLNIISSEPATLTSPGYVMLGNQSGPNLGIDYRTLQARNNGDPSSLFLNFYGGNVWLGESGALVVNGGGANLNLGNFSFLNDNQSIRFPNPGTTPSAMIYMFRSGTTNKNRMVIAHSPGFPTWGLRYSDNSDQFDFVGASTSRLSINLSNGNVGVGVVSPVNKLEVCGTIRAKEVRVETGWCDYVFDKDHKLRTLDELETYINENKHLPGIPTASEVEQEGLKLGEMNKAMMEKVEELSLYVIQLSKDNKKLQAEIDALKKSGSHLSRK
jgi:hypothetical protein